MEKNKLSRTTQWRVKRGISPGHGSDYHNPVRNYNFVTVPDYNSVKKIVVKVLATIVPRKMISNIIDDAIQEAIISMASGRSALAGVSKAVRFSSAGPRGWTRTTKNEMEAEK